jgi:hypothetical protein
MDELQADIGAPQRNAGLQHARQELLHEDRRPRDEAAVMGQPFADRGQPIARGEPGVQEPTTAATSSVEVR